MTCVLTKTVDAAQGRIQGRGVGCLNLPSPLEFFLSSCILLMNWLYTEGQTVPNSASYSSSSVADCVCLSDGRHVGFWNLKCLNWFLDNATR